MKSIFQKKVTTSQDTQRTAQRFYDTYLKDIQDATLFFEGGLGVGKTLFIRSILQQAGITQDIPSPTYTILQEYDTEHQHFLHFDFYRLSHPDDFFARGFDEIVAQPNIACVEWPEKITPQIQKGFSGTHYTIRMTHGIGVGMRTIDVLQPL